MITPTMIKFAILMHDIGKHATPENILPHHYEHEMRGLEYINKIADRLKAPNEYRNFALLCCKNHMRMFKIINMKISKQYKFVKDVSNNFKDKNLLESFLIVCKCDHLSENDSEDLRYEFKLRENRMRKIFDIMHGVNLETFDKKTQETLSRHSGEDFGKVYEFFKIKYLEEKIKEEE